MNDEGQWLPAVFTCKNPNPLPALANSQSAAFELRLKDLAPFQSWEVDPQKDETKDSFNFNHITISRDGTQGSGDLQDNLVALTGGYQVSAQEFAAGLAHLDFQYKTCLSAQDQKIHAPAATKNQTPYTLLVEESDHDSTPISDTSSSRVLPPRDMADRYESDDSWSDREIRAIHEVEPEPRIRERYVAYPSHRDVVYDQPLTGQLSYEDLHYRIRELENRLLRPTDGQEHNTGSHRAGATPVNLALEKWRFVHRLNNKYYLDRPKCQPTRRGVKIRGQTSFKDLPDYLHRNPQLDFVVIRDYNPELPTIHHQSKDSQYAFELRGESILLTSDPMIRAVVRLTGLFPDFRLAFPRLNRDNEIDDPSLFMYYLFPLLYEKLLQLGALEQETVKPLFDYLEGSVGADCRDAISHINSAQIFSRHTKYLIRPGKVVVNSSPVAEAFMVLSWPRFLGRFESEPDESPYPKEGETVEPPRAENGTTLPPDEMSNHELWSFKAWRLGYNGRFYKEHQTLEMRVTAGVTTEVGKLEFFPLQYAIDEAKALLRKRGETYWRCRERSFVGYSDGKEEFETANERFMVDYTTYSELHRNWNEESRDFINLDTVNRKDPPQDDLIYLFPLTAIGYNVRLKKWVDIEVDRIRDIQWDKKAFENLVIDKETKHLIQSLVSSRIAVEKSTDLIRGKGNGLIMLLHGGPGTGKTFTAESVAELAEKPLYRVTCGDIGTTPVDVEKYLESVLHLGKIWDCEVVLLDEADVFLEERSLSDLQRNALVSVFLRVLEYYDGILILTSNRVGTFDQAFKSRIQLALHYEDLKKPQRRKIWRNFFNRLKEVDETNVDFDDLFDNIDNLAEEEMNGRQIRNSITIARQLAQYDRKEFSYEQLNQVISIAAKFDGYLKGVYHGLSQEAMARDASLR